MHLNNYSIRISGNSTLIAAMAIIGTGNGYLDIRASSSLTTNGCTVYRILLAEGTLTLQDNLALTEKIQSNGGSLNTNNKTVTCGTGFYMYVVGTFTLGSSIINCPDFEIAAGSTVPANTATINCSGNFAGGGITTYNIVNLTGATSTISGNNTFATLALPAATTQTITFTAGSIQTIGTATLDGDATHAHTIKSGTAGTLASLIATTVTETYVTYTDMRLSWETLEVGEVLVYNKQLSLAETENIRMATRWRYGV